MIGLGVAHASIALLRSLSPPSTYGQSTWVARRRQLGASLRRLRPATRVESPALRSVDRTVLGMPTQQSANAEHLEAVARFLAAVGYLVELSDAEFEAAQGTQVRNLSAAVRTRPAS